MTLQPTVEADFCFAEAEPFRLDCGEELSPVRLHYAMYGTPNARRDNVVLVCHALSGSARVADWWEEMFGEGRPFDTSRLCIVCANVLGSCYGSTGPRDLNRRTGRPYGASFPVISIGDNVRAQALLMDHLGVERVRVVIGGSIGGMQALDWAVRFPGRVERCIAIGACPISAMSLALGHLQRQAILNDPAWKGGEYEPDAQPVHGLALARAIAMCTYKSPELFDKRFGRKPNRNGEQPDRRLTDRFDVGGYLDYQGEIFVRRFDANSYLVISKGMDLFDLGRTPEEERRNLARIEARMTLIGISSDWLFPPERVRSLAERMREAGVAVEYLEQQSDHGHDAFLADAEDLARMLGPL
jgi:homoserine O-acetyltransferase